MNEKRKVLNYEDEREVIIQHDYNFYSTVYFKGSTNDPVFFLQNQETGVFEKLSVGNWYMAIVLEKLSKISSDEIRLIDKPLVYNFRWAIREGYQHMLDPALRREYDSPRIHNNIKAVRSYIDKIKKKSQEEMDNP